VQRGDGRDAQRSDEVDDVVAVVAAPDAVFMLDRDDVDAALQRSRYLGVVGELVASDPVVDLDRVRRCLLGRMQGDDLAAASRFRKIVREGRDAAAPGRVRGNECSLSDQGLLSAIPSLRSMHAADGAAGHRIGDRGMCPGRVHAWRVTSGRAMSGPRTGRSRY